MASSGRARTAIVGSGPAGFYAAKYLAEANVSVDILERLPVPFGLVRYGVAPDHPEVKSVESTFAAVAANPAVRFFGNVEVGQAVSVSELQAAYDGVILAYGASQDQPLGLKGEGEMTNVLPARALVNWYNGHPDSYETGDVVGNLLRSKTVEHVVIVGNGNVALDCARILAKDAAALAPTDITQSALNTLARTTSALKSISIVGRRGVAQAAFTIKELRELTRLPRVRVRVLPDELEASLTEASTQEVSSSRPRTRIMELLRGLVSSESCTGGAAGVDINLRFLLRPAELVPSEADAKQVGAVRLQRTALTGPANQQRAIDVGTPNANATLQLPCDLLLSSVGYRSLSLPGVPWDERRSIVPNSGGRVVPRAGADVDDGCAETKGLYVVGWLKRGPTGIIASAVGDAKETVQAVLRDLEPLSLAHAASRPDPASTLPCLAGAGAGAVSWGQYLLIDESERAAGQRLSPAKPREKLTSVGDMMQIARKR